MNSSTSNSNVENQNQTTIFLKIVVALSLGMLTSLFLVRAFTFVNDARASNFLGRVLEARDAIPIITQENEDVVMVFGSSMVEAGFSSRQFDRELAEQNVNIKSFNFGFGGLNPYFQDILSRRIKEGFLQQDKKLKLAILEFNPFQTTQTRYQGAVSLKDSFESYLLSSDELWELTKQDPKRGIRLYNIRYLRDGVSAEMITSFFGRGFQPPPKRTDIPVDEEANKLRRELSDELVKRFEQDYPDYQDSNWSYQWQGAGTIPEERSKETLTIFEQYYAAGRNQHRMDNDKLNRIDTADIIELRFEPELVEAYIRIVENFKAFSEHVDIILLPRNTEWINYSPEGKKRLFATMAYIEKRTGIKVKNYQDLDVITPDMFSDTTHLARYSGDVAFTRFLVNEYKGFLQ